MRNRTCAAGPDSARGAPAPRSLSNVVARAAAALALSALPALAAFADEAKSDDAGKDWPCHQILVEKYLCRLRSGPPIDDIDWRKDEATADLVALLAARKTPMDAADQAIQKFAAEAGADKTKKLTALFAGLFETLNNERSDIIDGLTRFGRKQKALAAKICAENAELEKAPDAASPQGVAPDNPQSQKLELDLRAFDEGEFGRLRVRGPDRRRAEAVRPRTNHPERYELKPAGHRRLAQWAAARLIRLVAALGLSLSEQRHAIARKNLVDLA